MLKVVMLSLLIVVGLFSLPVKASALLDNWPGIPGNFPPLYNYFNNCLGNDHAQNVWISTSTDSSNIGPITLSPGQNSVSLIVNAAAAVCNVNVGSDGGPIRKNLVKTYNVFNGQITASSGIQVSSIPANTAITVNYGCINLWWLRYAKQCPGGLAGADIYNRPEYTSFNATGFGSLAPGTYNITFTANLWVMNEFYGTGTSGTATTYTCVTSPAQTVPTVLSYTQCTNLPVQFIVSVVVPQPTGYGTLKTTKYEVDSAGTTIALANSAAAVTSSAIRYYYSNTNLFFPTGTESGTTNPVERDRIDTTVNPFGADVVVPSGYKLLRASTSNPSSSSATTQCTDNVAKTGTCKVVGIQVVPNTTTTVDFFIQRISLASLGDLSCTTENGKNYFTGWGIDKDAQGNSPTVGIYEGTTLKQTLVGNVPSPSRTAYLGALGYAIADSANYDIKVELADLFHDGAVHTVTPKINEKILANITFGGTTANCGGVVVTKYLWPWLQTTGGNVVANGKITGLPASDTNLGARLATNPPAKEVEFLIISKVGGGGPFCSNKNYILTNASAATDTTCGNGSSYSVLNTVSVAGTEDKVVAGVKAAYNDLPAGCKGTTASNADFTNTASIIYPLLNKSATDCPNGVIIKYTGTSLASLSLLKGRVTILVEGDLTIGQNVGYGTTPYSNPRDVPNLAIVVRGNVKVLSDTPRVDASIYATGYISTCDTASNATIEVCRYPLTINGFLSAQSGFTFGRAYINDYNAQAVPPHAPAEIINLTLQSVVYPPPGIDYNSVFRGDSSVKIDSSEYQPRF